VQVFFRCFRDSIRVPRIENRVLSISEDYYRVPRIRGNGVPTIREIGSLQVQTGYLTFSLKQPRPVVLKLGVNYPLRIICDSSGDNAESNPQCFFIMSDHCEILRVIRHIRHLDLGNRSNKFGNRWFRHLKSIGHTFDSKRFDWISLLMPRGLKFYCRISVALWRNRTKFPCILENT